MQGQYVITLVETVKKKKEELQKKKKDRVDKQVSGRQAFLKCKFKCLCELQRCAVLGLKELGKCGNILQSVCSKAGYKEGQQKPTMILHFAALHKTARKPLFREEFSEEVEEEEEMRSVTLYSLTL